jgi:hypothetical protein
MKIKILKNIDVDIDKTKLHEVWPKYLHRNDVFNVDKIETICGLTFNYRRLGRKKSLKNLFFCRKVRKQKKKKLKKKKQNQNNYYKTHEKQYN